MNKHIKGFKLQEMKPKAECSLELLWNTRNCGWFNMSLTGNGALMVEPLVVIGKRAMQAIDDFAYLPPLISKPKVLTHNRDSAYNNVNKFKVFKSIGDEGREIRLDVLNSFNSTALSIDEHVLKTPMRPKSQLTKDNVEQFIAFRNKALEVYQYILDNGNVFYLDHSYEFRGRVFSLGHWIHMQSMPYIKALINLKEPYELNVNK